MSVSENQGILWHLQECGAEIWTALIACLLLILIKLHSTVGWG